MSEKKTLKAAFERTLNKAKVPLMAALMMAAPLKGMASVHEADNVGNDIKTELQKSVHHEFSQHIRVTDYNEFGTSKQEMVEKTVQDNDGKSFNEVSKGGYFNQVQLKSGGSLAVSSSFVNVNGHSKSQTQYLYQPANGKAVDISSMVSKLNKKVALKDGSSAEEVKKNTDEARLAAFQLLKGKFGKEAAADISQALYQPTQSEKTKVDCKMLSSIRSIQTR